MVNEDTVAIIDVLANDTDDDGDLLTVESVTQPANGTVINNGTDVTYTPNPNFNGADTFTYTITDGNGGIDVATVIISVIPANDDPVASDDSIATDEDVTVTIDVLANDTDVDGDVLIIQSVTQPTNGAAINNGADVIYAPNLNFNGVDTFTYIVIDGNGGTATASVTVAVIPANDDPVASDDSATTNEDEPVVVDVLLNDTDIDGDTLTVASVTQPANGTVINNGVDVTYTPSSQLQRNRYVYLYCQ